MATVAGMPVVVEPMGGGSRRIVWVFDQTDTALLLARGARFPRLGSIQPLARLLWVEDEYDDAGVP